MNYKRPESVLVVIYAKSSGRVLMLHGAMILIFGSR